MRRAAYAVPRLTSSLWSAPMKNNRRLSFALFCLAATWAWASPVPATMFITGNGGTDDTNPQQYYRFYSGADPAFIGQPYNWSGVGESNGGSWATMISPSFFLSATHDHPGAGSTVTFYSGNSASGQSYVATVEGGSQIAGSDVWLGYLSQPIPASAHIADYPVLTLPSNSDYVGKTIYTYGSPNLVGRNVILEHPDLLRDRRDDDGHVL